MICSAVGWLGEAVNHGNITVADSRLNHRVAVDAAVECGFGVTDKIAVEIYRIWRASFGRDSEIRL